MSISWILFFASCFGMFKLGAFTERNPGQLWAWAKQLWKWVNQ
jgi:hypothetical protein